MENTDPQAKRYDTFHRYLDLPFELRAPIRAFAINAAISTCMSKREDSLSCSRLASVSKEWQLDVEKALFSKIRIAPSDEEVSKFERYFTDRTKKYLKLLEVDADNMGDDRQMRLPWEIDTSGLSATSQFMAKAGHLFQQLSSWDFSSDGNKKHSIAVVFTSAEWILGRLRDEDNRRGIGARSLWEPSVLSRATRNGVPTDIALWAIKSEFPSTLNMVTNLTLAPDCVPIAAAKRIIQVMPNLQCCTFETCFSWQAEQGWRGFTDFIQQLQVSAPALRDLRLKGRPRGYCQDVFPASMAVCMNALRDLSQRLVHLDACPFALHEALFLPFSEKADANAAVSGAPCTWPRLRAIRLHGFCQLPSLNQATLNSVDILVAAAKATSVMPNLKAMAITTAGGEHFLIRRGVLKDPHGPSMSVVTFEGFSQDEERTILAAYAHIIGTAATLVKEIHRDGLPPTRTFEALTQRTARCVLL